MLHAVRHGIVIGCAILLIAGVIWIDVTTTIWQELVIVSGLAAGVVTFLLTTLFLDRFVQRAAQRRWAPVTRLALTEILHELADDQHSEPSRGHIEPRQLPTLDPDAHAAQLLADTQALRQTVADEGRQVATMLGTWWDFLSALTDNEQLIRHIADVTVLFEQVRDLSLDVDKTLQKASQDDVLPEESQHSLAQLNTHILTCNESIAHIVAELSQRLSNDPATLSQEAQQTLSRLRRRQGTRHHRRAKN
ncbi:hypothetical protein [Enteractinococcus helveticum]|uniref:hypothetical protein n=1 Tax=Enteractinococcus helveticum TaxID=1837282 RepID=UPI000A7E82B9|nr:hypothetical protein [Enteractinococcus helveticum]